MCGKKYYLYLQRLSKFLHYIYIGNHSVVYLKLIQCYISTLSQLIKKTGRKGLTKYQSAYRRCENIINLTELYTVSNSCGRHSLFITKIYHILRCFTKQLNKFQKMTARGSLSSPFYKVEVLIKRQPENLCMFGN